MRTPSRGHVVPAFLLLTLAASPAAAVVNGGVGAGGTAATATASGGGDRSVTGWCTFTPVTANPTYQGHYEATATAVGAGLQSVRVTCDFYGGANGNVSMTKQGPGPAVQETSDRLWPEGPGTICVTVQALWTGGSAFKSLCVGGGVVLGGGSGGTGAHVDVRVPALQTAGGVRGTVQGCVSAACDPVGIAESGAGAVTGTGVTVEAGPEGEPVVVSTDDVRGQCVGDTMQVCVP